MDASPSPPKTVDPISIAQDFAHLFRFQAGVLAALAACATVYAVDSTTPFWKYLLVATILLCMTSAACAINDYWDLDKDRIDHPDRPLPSGRLSPEQAKWAAALLFGCALIAAMPFGLAPFLLVLVCTVLLWGYSHLLTYSGIFGNGIVATIVAALILLGSLVANRPFSMLYPIGFLFIFAFSKEIVWDVHDSIGDRAHHIVTIPNLWGDQIAFTIVWILLGGLLISVPLAAYWLPMSYPSVFLGFSITTLFSLSAVLAYYQKNRSDRAYNQFILWERISAALGIIALLATAPPGT